MTEREKLYLCDERKLREFLMKKYKSNVKIMRDIVYGRNRIYTKEGIEKMIYDDILIWKGAIERGEKEVILSDGDKYLLK